MSSNLMLTDSMHNAHREFSNVCHYRNVHYWVIEHLKENPNDENAIQIKVRLEKIFEELKIIEEKIEKYY